MEGKVAMRNSNKIFALIIICISLAILASCQYVSNSGNVPLSQPSPMFAATLQSYTTPLSVFEYLDQVTDGKLLLSIELVNNKCSHTNVPIEVRIIFKNLTDTAITLPADFSIAVNRKGMGGNLIPFITTREGKDVLSLADYQLVDIFSTPSNIYKKIPAEQEVNFDVKFKFPQTLVASQSAETYELATPNPGQYLIRFVYSEYRRSDDIWYGKIGSNRIEICILN